MMAKPHAVNYSQNRDPAAYRTVACLVLMAAVAGTAACERRERASENAGSLLTLRVETPEALDWGGTGLLRLTLANEGEVMTAGGIVEVYVPEWLEFGTVEPAGTEVTVVSGDMETRFQYQLTDSLAPGDSRIVVQHLRVQRRVTPALLDTIDTVQLPPTNQVVRARLLTVAGEPSGVEVQAALNFVGWRGPLPEPPHVRPDTAPATTDTIARPRVDSVRDTTLQRQGSP